MLLVISSNTVLCQYSQGGAFTVWNFEKQKNVAEKEEISNVEEHDQEKDLGRSSLQRQSTNVKDYYDDLGLDNYDYGDYYFKTFER